MRNISLSSPNIGVRIAVCGYFCLLAGAAIDSVYVSDDMVALPGVQQQLQAHLAVDAGSIFVHCDCIHNNRGVILHEVCAFSASSSTKRAQQPRLGEIVRQW